MSITFASKQELAEFLGAEIDAALKRGNDKAREREDVKQELLASGDMFLNRPIPIKGRHVYRSKGLNDPEKWTHVRNFLLGQIMPAKQMTPEMVRSYEGAIKAMSIGTAGSGGYLVPTDLSQEILLLLENYTALLGAIRNVPMDGAKLNFPTVTAGPTMYWPGENTAITNSTPTTGNVALSANPAGILVYMSRGLAASTKVDVVALLAELIAEARGDGYEDVITGGTGSSQPTGFRDAGYTSILSTAQAAAALDWTDLNNLRFLLARKYRKQCAYMVNSAGLKLVANMADDMNRPIWTPPNGDIPGTIMGRPYLENEAIPDNLGVGTDETEIWCGAWKFGYVWGDMGEDVIESTTEGGDTFAKHQLAVKAVSQVDGKVGIQTALAKLTGVK